ncbi:MAG: CHASE4 domain-containing protein [Patescibacteria group bacterium]
MMVKATKVVTFLFLLAVFSTFTYFSFSKVTTKFIKDFNRSMLQSEIETVKTAFSRRTETIARLNADWSQWDDSYQFVQDLNNSYIEANLVDETFQSANLNMILFFDRNGNIVYKKARSLGGIGDTSIPAEVFNYTTNNNRINIQEIISSGKQQTGFLSTTQGTFIFAVSPIITSEGEGPAMGALMMARYFNNTDLEELKQYTGFNLDFVEHTSLGNWQHPEVTYKDIEKRDFVVEKNDVFSVYTLTKDSWGNDAKVINLQHKIVGLNYVKKLTLTLTAISGIVTGLFGLTVLSARSTKDLYEMEEKVIKNVI